MLRTISIENIAVIERADIDFMDGFIVLCGETGAGKSIIIDALNAVLGARVSRDIIRTGARQAVASALFADISPAAAAAAARLGFPAEGGELLLRREIFADGRNVCKINGRPAVLSMLRELGALLLTIHGQHDGQSLLDELRHMEYLDSFAALEPQLAEYRGQYDELLQLNRRIRSMSLSAEERERKAALLRAQVGELADAAVREGEQEELSARRAALANAEKIMLALADAHDRLDGAHADGGACDALSMAAKSLAAIEKYGAPFTALHQRAGELSVLALDLAGDLSAALAHNDFTPRALETVEARLDLLARLVKKHGCVSADELPDKQAELAAELESLEHYGDDLEALKAQYAQKREVVFAQACALHDKRAQAAERLSEQIGRELFELDMPNARFVVALDSTLDAPQTRFTKRGTDTARFLLSSNRGEELKPLAKVASGGELSRVMLAIKTVLDGAEPGMTAVFDEIDAGVSGQAASRVGEKLYGISRLRQVLCVTHLPQIASLADHQYDVSKNERGGRTFTSVEHLDEEGRIRALARLTAGLNVTSSTHAYARDMLHNARERKTALRAKDGRQR